MENKIKIIIIEILVVTILGLLFGTISGGSLLYGDINLIDEGQFAAWANHLMHGKKMYQDIYITYGPLYVYPVYMIFSFFGSSAFSVRLVLVLGNIIGVIVILFIFHSLKIRFLYRWIVLLTLLFLPLMQLRQGVGLLAVLFLIQSIGKNGIRQFLLAGIASSLSFLVSPDIGVIVAVLSFIILSLNAISVKDLSIAIKQGLFYLLGGGSVFLPFFLWSFSEGWFLPYVHTTVDVMVSLSGIEASIGQGFPNALTLTPENGNIFAWGKYFFSRELLLYWGALFYIVSGLYFLLRTLTYKISILDKKVLVIFIFGIMLYHILLGRSGLGHFFFVLSPILIIGSYFAQVLMTAKKEKNAYFPALLLLVVMSLFLIRIYKIYYPNISKNIIGIQYRMENNGKNERIGLLAISPKQENHILNMQSFINKNTQKKSPIFFLSDEPGMYMLVDRHNPTRFDLPFIASTKEKRFEMLADLKINKPKYIFENKSSWAVDGINNRRRLPEIIEFITVHYSKVATIDDTVVYQLRKEQ